MAGKKVKPKGKASDVEELKAPPQKKSRSNENILAASPESVSTALIVDKYKVSNGIELDSVKLYEEFVKQAKSVIDGDDSHLVRTLMAQLETTNTLFYTMATRLEKADTYYQLKLYANLALQFQNQSRRTAATVKDILHPKRATFVKQANMAVNQQVNNGINPESENKSHTENQLMEAEDVERLDTGAQEASIGINPSLETVGKGDRAKVRRGQT